jgi:hypothetical protein
MIDYSLLTHDQLMKENFRLTQIIDGLKKEKEEYEKCTSRINPPNKSYKELENKLALAENSKQAEIDELYETKIGPLQNEAKDRKIQLESAYKTNESQKDRIKALEMSVAYLILSFPLVSLVCGIIPFLFTTKWATVIAVFPVIEVSLFFLVLYTLSYLQS